MLLFHRPLSTGVLALSLAATSLLGVAAPTSAESPAPTGATQAVSSYQSQITNDGTTVFHPTNMSGDLPVALLLQGGKVHRQHYTDYAATIASYGFIVVTPNHRRLNFFDVDYYTSTSQVGETLEWMEEENADAASPLAGKIDEETLVLLGHSFGGATGLSIAESACSIPFCTGLSFTLPAEVKAASFFGTNNTFLGSNPSISNRIPVQLVQGQADGVAAPTEAEATYAALQNGPKQIVRVAGVNHYGITNTQDPSGANAETAPQAVSQASSIETSARWAAQFLLAQLGDAAALTYVQGAGDAADPNVTTTSSGL